MTHRIAIIGAGFSGVMTLYHLVTSAIEPIIIQIYDKTDNVAQGRAYKTKDITHLLNVPAKKMGAFAENPEHFWQWMQQHRLLWQRLHPDLRKAEYTPDSFVPRLIYGAYLQYLLNYAIALAKSKGHVIELRTVYVRKIDADGTVQDSSGDSWQADAIILATGHPATKTLPALTIGKDERILQELWDDKAQRYWDWFKRNAWDSQSHLVIIGTGLSAIDMLQSVIHLGFKGKITMMSRHGLLPKVHKKSKKPVITPDILEFPRTALGIYQKIDRAIEQSDIDQRDWRAVIDSLRPISNQLWDRLPMNEKRRFLRDFMSWWNVLRHRMPQESYELVKSLTESGQLTVLPASLLHVSAEKEEDKLILFIKQRGEEDPESIVADSIINASGYHYDIAQSHNSLLLYLRDHSMIDISPLRMGIRTDGQYRALPERLHHNRAYQLYALGPLLFGERLESTAVHELRQQAEECANIVLYDLKAITLLKANIR